MPRYVVERTFADALELQPNAAEWCGHVVARNGDVGVTWLHSYVSDDGTRTYCVYEGPSPEAIRKAATANKMPVDPINQVRVLDPYFLV
jgi:Nickel responsive protein SCO4226-like